MTTHLLGPGPSPGAQVVFPGLPWDSPSGGSGFPGSESVLVGTWNVSWWVQDRLVPIIDLAPQVLALQETKLSPLPLEAAKGALRRRGWSLHHGHPVPATRVGIYGEQCGVAFLSAPGVAVAPLFPRGPSWRRLHAMARVHAVEIPPRAGLPRGLRLFSVYAPLKRDAELKAAFAGELWSLVCDLDLQVPTLLMGDFNGSVDPTRDYSAGEQRTVCPVLSRLLGPGGPLIDLHRALCPGVLDPTFRLARGDGSTGWSRCDLILGNHAALPLVARVFVATGVMDGGHSPVLIELRMRSLAIPWTAPRPRLPAVLRLTPAELRASANWRALLDRWQLHPAFIAITQVPAVAHAQKRSSSLCCVGALGRRGWGAEGASCGAPTSCLRLYRRPASPPLHGPLGSG